VRKSDILEGSIQRLEIEAPSGRQSVLVMRDGDSLHAFLNRCPHAGWPLDTFDGRLLRTEKGDLICAAHMAVFDPRTGTCLGGPGQGRGLTPVKVEETEGGWHIRPMSTD
jgi:nitrite reductase/ring-hydroxylating ferredoxin subunit